MSQAAHGSWKRLACLLLLAAVAAPSFAPAATTGVGGLLPGAGKSEEFLPPDQAFRVSARAAGPGRVQLTWAIAPGYYLYRARLKFATSTPGVTLKTPELPEGDIKNDEYFGKQVVYHLGLIAHIDLTRPGTAAAPVTVAVTYQGCAEAGLCYPPTTRQLTVNLPAAAKAAGGSGGWGGNASSGASEQDSLATLIRSGSMLAVLGIFFLAGLGLAFTPCCLPMVPILSGLIAGHGKHVTTARSFALSLSYVLGMAATYTTAGALTAALGLQVQAIFQQTWIILLFAGMFVALALSMFGVYTLQMPAAIQTRLAATSNQQRAGTYAGVAVMGALSALIVTTCVAPPLVAALAVIGQTGDVLRGASALFAMSIGMGAPLLVVGASAGRLLPKAGAWMDTVKQLFGAMMLGVAAWMLARLVGDRVALLLYVVPLLAAIAVLWRQRSRGVLRLASRGAALAAGVYAMALGAGAWRGATDPLHPLAAAPAVTVAAEVQFHPIASLAELDREVQAAALHGQPVLLDFYADWCTSCKEMERYTFTDPQVRAALGHMRLLRADVTANNADDQALLQHFGIFGPPTIAFYGSDGQEQAAYRVVGYMKAAPFVQVLGRVTTPGAAPGAGA